MTKLLDFRYLTLILITGLAVDGCSESALAGTGQVITLPRRGVKASAGVRLTIDTRWVAGNGYRPVRVQVSPLGGGVAPANRYFDVTIRPRGYYGGHSVAAAATVHLPQGKSFGATIINVPETNLWMRYDITTHEDGRRLEDLSTRGVSGAIRFNYERTDASASVLILHRTVPASSRPSGVAASTELAAAVLAARSTVVPGDRGLKTAPGPRRKAGSGKSTDDAASNQQAQLLPDVRVLAGCFPTAYFGGTVTFDRVTATNPTTDAEILRLVNDLAFLDILDPQALPDQWLSYSSIDVLLTSLEDLKFLARRYPRKWQALCKWLSTGAVLCVWGMGADFQQLPQLERLMGLSPDGTSRANALDAWTAPDPKRYRSTIKALESSDSWWRDQAMAQAYAAGISSSGNSASARVKLRPANKEPFLLRSVGQTQLVAIAAENPFPGTERDWNWVFNSVPSSRWLWYQRHGISNRQDNDEFWNFLIPGIGRAPVFSFLALITLFAIAIGPVNYYLLRRGDRLSWMLVTVPAGAGLVTVGLFSYATLADGLGVRAGAQLHPDRSAAGTIGLVVPPVLLCRPGTLAGPGVSRRVGGVRHRRAAD